MQRHEAGFGAEAEHRQRKRDGRPARLQPRRAHGVERELPAAALQHPEAQQDGHRAHVGDQQVDESGAADLGDAVLGRHQEVGRDRHRFPRDHEPVGIVRQQHETHARQKQVVLQTQQARRRTLAAAEIAGGEHGDSRATRAEQQQERARERVQSQVKRQIGQTERQREPLFVRTEETRRRNHRQCQSEHGAQRKQRAPGKAHARGTHQTGAADAQPPREQGETGG